MSKMNILVYLNAYRDSNPTNNPTMSHFKWTREFQGLSAGKPQSLEFTLAPGEFKELFNGLRALMSDNTTTYSLTLKSGNTFSLKHTAGTPPSFRRLRSISSDATTAVTVTVSGNLVTFTSTAGTDFNFSTTSVGDEVSVGTLFNAANQGRFQVLAKTATSIVIENSSGVAEGPIVLGAGFEDQFRVYSSSGVQKGDKIKIEDGFSSTSHNTYEITGVQDNEVEFYSSKILAPETGIVDPTIVIYSSAKKFVYLEADQKVGITVNAVVESGLEPFVEGSNTFPGVYMKKSTLWSMEVVNNSTEMATLYVTSIE